MYTPIYRENRRIETIVRGTFPFTFYDYVLADLHTYRHAMKKNPSVANVSRRLAGRNENCPEAMTESVNIQRTLHLYKLLADLTVLVKRLL